MTLTKKPCTVEKICTVLLATLLLYGCQTIINNETTYEYILNEELLLKSNVKRVVIAHENLGIPSRKFLQPHSSKIDKQVQQQLVNGGFTVVDNREFQSLWRGAVRKHGAPYRAQSGQVNHRALEAILYDVLEAVREQGIADAVLFTDIVERNVQFSGRNQRMARWDGVARPPKLRSGSSQLSAEFDWSQSVSASTVLVVLYNTQGEFIFKGAGGLEVTREIDTRSGNGRFVRRKDPFTNPKNIRQGVSIALHPLVPMEGYINHHEEQE